MKKTRNVSPRTGENSQDFGLDLTPDTEWVAVQKLVTLPAKVWEDVKKLVWAKYKMNLPKENFRFMRYLHSKNFDYADFIASLNVARSAILFALITRKLGIRLLRTKSGLEIIQTAEYKEGNLDMIMDAYKKTERSSAASSAIILNGQRFDSDDLMDKVEQLDMGNPAPEPRPKTDEEE